MTEPIKGVDMAEASVVAPPEGWRPTPQQISDYLAMLDRIQRRLVEDEARAIADASVVAEGRPHEKTIIGLDYDGTITRDPDMWFAVMKTMQAHGHEVHIVTMRHGVESLMGSAPMEQRFLDGANDVHFTGNATTGDRDAKRPHMEAKGIEVHIWIEDNPKAVHMSAREIWGWCTQPGDTMIHSAPEIVAAAPVALAAVGARDEQSAFQEWMVHERPSGDAADVQYQWANSHARMEWEDEFDPPKTAEPLCGWKIDAACQAMDSDGDIVAGIWELGHRDGDGNFYAIATVDTGNYGQPEAAEPLARAILARLTAPQPPAAPAKASTVPSTREIALELAARATVDTLDLFHSISEGGERYEELRTALAMPTAQPSAEAAQLVLQAIKAVNALMNGRTPEEALAAGRSAHLAIQSLALISKPSLADAARLVRSGETVR